MKDVFKHRAVGVFLHGKQVLIHKERTQSYWSLPGGKIRFGETSIEALEREILEETGILPQTGRLLWVSENLYQQEKKKVHEIAFYYLAQFPSSTPEEYLSGGFDGIEKEPKLFFQWWNVDDLLQLDLYPQFLREKLNHLPKGVEHLVYRQAGDV